MEESSNLDKICALSCCKKALPESWRCRNHLEELTMRQAVGDEAGKILALQGDILAKLRSGALSVVHLERFLRKEDPFDVSLLFHFTTWNRLFREVFGLDIPDLGKTIIPEYRPGFSDVIIVPADLALNRVFLRLQEMHHPGSYSGDIMDKLVGLLRRQAQTYAVRCRDCILSDSRFFGKNLGYLLNHELSKPGRASMQLIEYLLYNMYRVYYGQSYLDLQSHTVFLETQFTGGRYCVADFYRRSQDLEVLPWPDTFPADTGPREVLVA